MCDFRATMRNKIFGLARTQLLPGIEVKFMFEVHVYYQTAGMTKLKLLRFLFFLFYNFIFIPKNKDIPCLKNIDLYGIW